MITVIHRGDIGLPYPTPPAKPPPTNPLERRDAPPLEVREGLSEGDMNLLYELEIFARDTQRAMGIANIEGRRRAEKIARRRMEQALKKAKAEAKKKAKWGKIFSTLTFIAKVAAVVAAIASLVVSSGATGPAILALSGTLMSIGAKPVGEKLGGKKLETGMLIGGAVLSLSAGIWSLASTSATAAGKGAEGTDTGFKHLMRYVAKGAMITEGGATTASGYATYKRDLHDSLELDANADATAARAQQRFAMRQLNILIESLKDMENSFKRGLEALSKAADAHAASKLVIAGMGVRS